MKKIAILFLSILLTACTANAPVVENQNTKVDGCENLEQTKKDECYVNIASEKAYSAAEISEEDVKICDNISKESPNKNYCYWMFAMSKKDKDLCKLLPQIEENSYKSIDDLLYYSKLPCEKEIKYENNKTSWELKSGIPPYADPYLLVYSGEAELKGWIVNVPRYVGNPEPHFHVADESLNDLPYGLIKRINSGEEGRRDFILIGATPEVMEKLAQYNEQNPATIKVNEVNVYIEGSAGLNFVKIIE